MNSPDRSWTTAGISDDALEALTRTLPASRLWSLLLDVMGGRATERSAAALVEQWKRDGFTRPSQVDQRVLIALDGDLLAAAHAFEAVELSPLAPLGSCSVVGPTSQNKIVSALRGTEVVSDPTNVLALECAARLRRNPDRIVRLATSHRCVRAQEIPRQAGFSQHFRIFSLATAGRERASHGFVVDASIEHITTLLGALDRLEKQGYSFPERKVTILADGRHANPADRIAAAIHGVMVVREPLDHAYYHGLRFKIGALSAVGTDIPFIDGGAFDWVGKLGANRRFAFVASGMGSQLAAQLYGPRA